MGKNLPKSRMNKPLDIAIVGMAGLFPKANDMTEFWQNIVNNVGAFAPVGKERWGVEPDAVYSPTPTPDKAYSRIACLLDSVAYDFQGIDIDEELVRSLDPLYHVVLHTGRNAFLSCNTRNIDRKRMGTILAAIAFELQQFFLEFCQALRRNTPLTPTLLNEQFLDCLQRTG